jgi:hypothetical protein
MNRSSALFVRFAAPLVAGLVVAGCATFNVHSAREISQERLLALSEQGNASHILYMGSDFTYHYVFDSRPDRKRSYKIRAEKIKLQDTFLPGEDSYVLHPWVIEGTPFGSTVQEAVTNELPVEEADSDEPPAADDR